MKHTVNLKPHPTRAWSLSELLLATSEKLAGRAPAPSLATMKQWSRSGKLPDKNIPTEKAAQILAGQILDGTKKTTGPRKEKNRHALDQSIEEALRKALQTIGAPTSITAPERQQEASAHKRC